MRFEYIDENEVEVVKRGRKSQVPTEVVEAIKNMPAGKVVKFTEFTLDPADADYKNHKASLSSMLRQAGRSAGCEVRINYSTTGVPQVSKQTSKKKTAKK